MSRQRDILESALSTPTECSVQMRRVFRFLARPVWLFSHGRKASHGSPPPISHRFPGSTMMAERPPNAPESILVRPNAKRGKGGPLQFGHQNWLTIG